MTLQKKNQDELAISEQLYDIQDYADSGQYQRAMEMVLEARDRHPQNIFLIAIEKQLDKLLEMKKNDELTNDNVDDALSPLPHLIKRAIDDINNERHGIGETPAQRAAAQKEQEASAAAIQRLKSQYFDHAEESMERGDYESALNEIRRVKIIDPANHQAKDLEQRILFEIEKLEHEPVAAPTEDLPGDQSVPDLDFLEVVEQTPTLEIGPAPGNDLVEFTVIDTAAGGSFKAPPSHSRHLRQGEEPAPKKKSIPFGFATVALILFVAVIMIVRSLLDSGTPPQSSLPMPEPRKMQAGEEPAVSPIGSQVEDMNVSPPENKIDTKISPPGTRLKAEQVNEPQRRSIEQPTRKQESSRPASSTSTSRARPKENSVASQKPPSVAKVADDEPATKPPTPVEKKPAATIVYEERLPQVKKIEQPRFPDAARQLGINGEVIVRVQISTEGKPLQAKIVRSSNVVFNDPVIEAVMKGEYIAGTMSSGPVTTWITIPFRFSR